MQENTNGSGRQAELRQGGLVPYVSFPLLERTGIVSHAFTTRAGGVSRGIFSSLNFSFSRGDKKEDVEENYRRLAKTLGTAYESFACADQTHTANVARVGKQDAGNGIVTEQKYKDTDGMVTDEPGVTLLTLHADCVPLYFVDPVRRAVGLSHSGWRGTAGRIGEATLRKMKEEFGTDPKDVLAAIGPSICGNCYEVGEDAAEAFVREFPGREREILKEKGGGKYLLNLWKANEVVLAEAGVLPQHLAVSGFCTCCEPDRFFSHRASGGMRGNLAAVLALKEPQ